MYLSLLSLSSLSVCRVMQSFTFPMKTLTLFSCSGSAALPLLAKNYERDRQPTIDQIEEELNRLDTHTPK